MKVHIIPQELNIADRIGPFTIVQWVFIGSGVLIALVLLSTGFINTLLSIALGFGAIGLGLFLAFFKLEKQPIYEFLIDYFLYWVRPKSYIYSSDTRMSFEFEDDEDYVDIDIY